MRKHSFPLFCVLLIFLSGCFGPSGRPQQKSKTITVWHWMTDRHKTFEILAEKYEKETGVKVNFQLYVPSDIYSHKIIAAAQARVLPDIYGILDIKAVMADFIKSGFVADLTDEFLKNDARWEKSFFPKALAVNRFEQGNVYGVKPGIYGAPLDVMNIQMLYNKKLLKKAGFDAPPKTFDEFIRAAQTLKKLGIPPMVSGWGELWMINCFAFNYAFNIMGEEKIMATFRGDVPYTDPDWIKVFEVFKDLKEKNALLVGIVTKDNKYAEQDFALERAAFAFNGSWCVNVYNDMNPQLDYGVMLPPPVNKDRPMRIWGGAGSSFVVNNASVNKEAAVAFLKWLTQEGQQSFLAEQTKNLPANRKSMTTISPVLAEFASAMDYATHPTSWPLDEDASVKEKFDRGLQSIIIGEKTPQVVAKEVQEVKTRRMEKAKRRQAR